jgi:hypothetical protein
MILTKRIIKCIATILLVAMIVQTVSCGTLLYPERRKAISTEGLDPKGRQIDPAVAVMDAVCLLFFILPGVIAFAVDFSTGAIYLPGGKSGALDPVHPDADRIVRLPPDQMDKEMLSKIISRETGVDFSFEDKDLQAFEIDHPEDVGSLLVHFKTGERTVH